MEARRTLLHLPDAAPAKALSSARVPPLGQSSPLWSCELADRCTPCQAVQRPEWTPLRLVDAPGPSSGASWLSTSTSLDPGSPWETVDNPVGLLSTRPDLFGDKSSPLCGVRGDKDLPRKDLEQPPQHPVEDGPSDPGFPTVSTASESGSSLAQTLVTQRLIPKMRQSFHSLSGPLRRL